MLNKNQSHKRNSWKFAVVLPLLVAFVICFQVKVIAQEKEIKPSQTKESFSQLNAIVVDKNSTDSDLKKEAELFKNNSGIEVKFSKIKRNSAGEIIAIKIEYKDKKGHKGNSYTNDSVPISPITIFKTKNAVGIKSNETGKFSKQTAITIEAENNSDPDEVTDVSDVAEKDMSDFPAPPTPPTPPIAPEIKFNTGTPPNFPNPPTAPTGSPITNEKGWKKFEKKMAEFEKKMEAMEPEIEAYTLKMSNIDEQMKPFEKEMEVFEKKMEIFEKQMEEYQKKVEVYQEKNQKE